MAAASPVRSLSQIRVWDTDHLTDAATTWRTTADQWEESFSRVSSHMPAPRGIPWEGTGAEAARLRASTDAIKVREIAHSLRSASTVAANGAVERLRAEVMISGLSDWVSLAQVQKIISHFRLARTDSERQNLVLTTTRSLLDDGLMQIGELPGPNEAFSEWEPIDVAMDRLHERFVDQYAEPTSWEYSIWLGLTETGRSAAKALRAG